ncbi:MAG: 4-hydroxyphenylacetate 3-hydroxylase N-terminal domain-containing protein [Staphylococcus warneri]|uniref:4-hydroxyphenylacetate 3-hydroxylase N-terminal domain-containing protein n=1 Tax=Staphylococcus TaxID=1279 RepID=UPI00091C245F|nr:MULTISPECIES: 4-hydroxyphenylacetate 3-hydroxylase N-terminal domain-containing protein [Staphylococcus]MBF2232803.1 4-hydroxyphenylacetate 3-monooxygenase [Staphylococcus epidermidis]MCF7582251.1 4-hydroxyphenylacetate 3-monooxygenase [Staphylococcus epidermidis]MCG2193586.1 4-hydroxyphenylacetate 3-monooxygenase [Staphylococcus epidermidis]MCM3483483.1 4-hydroxyphenylacetate 3-monooxygenase [Staphylococcus warneri]MCR4501855.1 4-hydroxyphenylacetate 3-monooxygenase [Staphylococcus warneri
MNLKDGRKIFINGKRVSNILEEHKVFENTYKYINRYYQLQEERNYHTIYGSSLSTTFLKPQTKEDLKLKRDVYYDIAKESYGMLGRTPDFMNPGIMSLKYHNDFLGRNEYADFKQNAINYYNYISEKDLFVSHASINPQIDRSKKISEIENDYSGVHVKDFDENGILVQGAKMIVTLAPLADELLIFNMPGLKEGDENYAIAFSTPVNTKGVKVITRKTYDKPGYSLADYPLSNSLEEIDAYVIFDNVSIPWDNVFVFKDIEASNSFFDKSKIRHHTGHQDITRGLAKLEFISGIAIELAEKLGLSKFVNIQEELGYLTTSIELVKGGILLCEENAQLTNEGVLTPDIDAIQAVRYHLPQIYKKAVDLIQKLAAGSMLSVPSMSDYHNENRDVLIESLKSPLVESEYRSKLLNLSWDVTGETFGQRQKVYEYYHAGDPMRLSAMHYLAYPKEKLTKIVRDLLESI